MKSAEEFLKVLPSYAWLPDEALELIEARDAEHAAALAASEERVRELEDALRWILSHGWRTVHIGRELQKLSLIASGEQVKWLRTALEGNQ